MPEIVTAPDKIVTDSRMLRVLERDGIDKDYVEFKEDFNQQHPAIKIYYDRIERKHRALCFGVPRIYNGIRVDRNWTSTGTGWFASGANSWDSCLINMSTGQTIISADGEDYDWTPEILIGEKSVKIASLYQNSLSQNELGIEYLDTIIFDYGVCKRILNIKNGQLLEIYRFDAEPSGDIEIRSYINKNGLERLKCQRWATDSNFQEIGRRPGVELLEDVKRIPLAALHGAVYPVLIDDSFSDYPYNDFYMSHTDGTWSTCRTASTCDWTSDTWFVKADVATGYTITRAVWSINTSGLGAGATVSAADLNIDAAGGYSGGYYLYWHTGDESTAGWNDHTSKCSAKFNGVAGYKSISLTSFSGINTSGNTHIAQLHEDDADNNTPTSDEAYPTYAINQSGTEHDPYLDITYTPPPAGPYRAMLFD